MDSKYLNLTLTKHSSASSTARFVEKPVSGRGVGRLPLVLAWVALMAVTTGAVAQNILIPNASFESPTAPTGSGNPALADWLKAPEPPGFDPVNTGGFPWTTLSGVFDGGTTVPDGSQGAYLLSYPEVGIYQTLAETYQAGLSYTLTVALHGGAGGLTSADQLQIGLYYGGGLTPVTSVMIDYSALNFPDQNLYYDFDLTLPEVQPGDAWAGQNIGIEFTAMNGTLSGSWDLDNVRLTAVPEPSTFALLAGGFGYGLLVAYRRRKASNSAQPDAPIK
jgi:hypothetical protein